jgi:site-specific recombinase XerD
MNRRGGSTDRVRDLEPREAAERFLSHREGQNAPTTIRNYRNRLETFLEWAENHEEIKQMRDLDGYLLDEYAFHLQGHEHAPTTRKGKLTVLVQLLKYCARLEVVEPYLPHLVELPQLDDGEETSDVKLDSDDARALLQFYRNDIRKRGTAQHVVLELAWHVGGRRSCMRALDLDDWHPDDRVLIFRNREGTLLKRREAHERNVIVSEPVAEVIDFWIARERPQKRDEFGRKPLLTTTHGRAAGGTIQKWCYLATQPCLHQACPHNRERHSCEYVDRSLGSGCPSSRSPHQIRTGSITWQLNNGLSYDEVAARVAAKPSTIRRYYDKPDHDEALSRRLPETQNLDIETSPDWT